MEIKHWNKCILYSEKAFVHPLGWSWPRPHLLKLRLCERLFTYAYFKKEKCSKTGLKAKQEWTAVLLAAYRLRWAREVGANEAAVLSPGWISRSCHWLLLVGTGEPGRGTRTCLETGFWGSADIFPALTRPLMSLNVTHWVLRRSLVLWPPTASTGGCCFWHLLWVDTFLPLFCCCC